MEVEDTVGKQGKSMHVKSKYNRKTAQATKSDAKELLVHRRVFGTARNTNVPEKPVAAKPKWQRPSLKPVLATPPPIQPINKTTSQRKPLQNKSLPTTPISSMESLKFIKPVQTTKPVETSLLPEKPPKTVKPMETAPLAPNEPTYIAPLVPEDPPKSPEPVEAAPLAPDEQYLVAPLVPEETKEAPETTPIVPEEPPKPTKPVQTTPKIPQDPEKTAPANKNKKKKSVSFRQGMERDSGTKLSVEMERTPRPMKAKQRVSGTPYHTAERCSKCKFDRMETASYWVAQIKLAEAVGKHNVSVGLFKLALEAKAEPVRVLRAELKRYISRNTYLPDEAEWREITTNYGLNISSNDQVEVKAQDENVGGICKEQDDSTEQLESDVKY